MPKGMLTGRMWTPRGSRPKESRCFGEIKCLIEKIIRRRSILKYPCSESNKTPQIKNNSSELATKSRERLANILPAHR